MRGGEPTLAAAFAQYDVRRDLYMIESSGKLAKRFELVKEYVDKLMERLLETFMTDGK
jgi:hypothetical protein